MISEDLRKRMEEAYLAGNKEEALRLSQELDKQVVEEQGRVYKEYREEKITKQAAKDLGIKGDTIKLRPNTAIINTVQGWRVVDL